MPTPTSAVNAAVLARHVLVFLLLSLLLRLIANWGLAQLHLPFEPAFFDSRDIFADSLKSGLAERAVTAPLLTDPRVAHWPALFRGYLFQNPYLAPGMTIDWEPPLGALQLMGVGRLIVITSPWAALASEIAVYLLGVVAFAWLLKRLDGLSAGAALLLAAPLCLSYPALFMADRANFHSGFATLCLTTYFCTALTGRWRWLGVAALCYSINVRPNTCIVSMVELALAPSMLSAARLPLLIAASSGAVFVFSLLAAHSVDPTYTFSSFLGGYALYQHRYIVDGMGLTWNDSLYGAMTILRAVFGLTPAYSAIAFDIVTAVAVLTLLAFVWFVITGRLRRSEAVFIAAAFCVLFTPVYGQYHILIFAGVLTVLGLETAQGARRPDLKWAWPGFFLFIALGWDFDVARARGVALIVVLGVILAVIRLCAENEDDMIAVVSMLVLSPLGGQFANGLLIATLLAATLAALCVRAAKRPVQAAAPLMGWSVPRTLPSPNG